MSDDLFHSPKLKVERAKRHISDLQSEIDAFLERDPYRLVFEDDTEARKRNLVIRVRENIPCYYATIIGDAVHNLRSALDLLACDLVRLNGGDTSNVYFPFAKTREGLEPEIKRKMKGASPDVLDIIRALKPYPGGNDLLRGLHDLDIADKHVLLIPTSSLVGLPPFGISMGGSGLNIFENMRISPLVDGSKAISLPIDTHINVDGDIKGSFEITIGEGQPFEREPVIATLYQLTNLVERIIQTFEAHFNGNDSS